MYSYEFTKQMDGKVIKEKFETNDKNLGVEMALRFFKKLFNDEPKIKIKINGAEGDDNSFRDEYSGGSGGSRD